MDFALIERIAGADTAQKICDDSYLDDHIDKAAGGDVDGEQLDELIKGAAVLGAQPVDYPLTDGVYIYLKCRTGEVIALFFEAEAQGQDEGLYDLLRISRANIA